MPAHVYAPYYETYLAPNTPGITATTIWAIQRDNGGCPGSRGQNTCSGIAQNTWDFSHALCPFTT